MMIEKFQDAHLEAVCDVLGDTEIGLTGSEIGKLLQQSRICDIEPSMTKRHRLFLALQSKQSTDKCANNIIDFIQKSMSPSRFVRCPERFNILQSLLNTALVFAGYQMGDDGIVKLVKKAENLSEAKKRTQKLKGELELRHVHPHILKYCREELLQENYFHAVFEAAKSIAERIRELTGLLEDGGELVDLAFKIDYPLLIINKLQSETEKSEQRGFINFIKGVLGMFRNTTAHAPKIKWEINEMDAIEILSAISLVHRRLDNATVTALALSNKI